MLNKARSVAAAAAARSGGPPPASFQRGVVPGAWGAPIQAQMYESMMRNAPPQPGQPPADAGVTPSQTEQQQGGGGGGGGGQPAPYTPQAPPQDDGREAQQPQQEQYADQEQQQAQDNTEYYTEDQQQQPPTDGDQQPPLDPADARRRSIEESTDKALFYGEPKFPLVSAHTRNGRLNSVAIAMSPYGHCPVACSVPVGRIGDGPVGFGCDYGHQQLQRAINKSKVVLMNKAAQQQVRLQIEELVQRSRAGDQVAMAILAKVGKNAKAGDPRARFAYSYATNYVRTHPPNSSFAAETADKKLSFWATIQLANGEPLTRTRVTNFASSFGNEDDRQVFLHGLAYFRQKGTIAQMRAALDEWKRKVLDLGRTLGEARAIQMVRMPGAKVSWWNPVAGWELGE